ncbi:MAG: 4-hydroxy-tetrahydrodipicolinate synthase [Flavobacteriales bacterium]|jgi:4-hydroxy-tetrahydrodipicolinate synthase|nr:4-hydroxy-tetrahydrodipicolinate synthase [Flavobacteriales bacterium]
MEKFKGLGVALVTPFQDNGSVDFVGLQKLVEHQIANEVDYLVVQGTTGEVATLTPEEKQAVLDFVIEINNKRLPVVLGVGGNNTAVIVKTLEELNTKNIDGILSVSPYYNKPSQEGIYQHYKAVANATDLPIILYNVPGRTMSNMLPETTIRLANDFTNIIAIKEASGNLEQVMDIIQRKPEDFLVISGDDALTLPMLASGGDGLISVVSNAFPKRTADLVHTGLKGDFEQARQKHYELFDIINALFQDGNPGGVKFALTLLNICKNNVRLPLVPVNKKTEEKLYQLIANLGETLIS